MRPRALEILLLANDLELRELMVQPLKHHRPTVVLSPGEAAHCLRRDRYHLVIVTNFGVGPSEALSIIPAERDYPILFLTGFMDDEVTQACRDKRIPYRTVPIPIEDLLRELRLALEDVSL